MTELLGGKRKGYPVEGGGEIPIFTLHEAAAFTPEEMLSEMREFYISRGQWRSLERLDESVAENGNPYVRKPMAFPAEAAGAVDVA